MNANAGIAATRASVSIVGIVKPDAEFVNPYLAASSSLALLFVLVFLAVFPPPLLVGLNARMVSNSPAPKTSDANCADRVLVILADEDIVATVTLVVCVRPFVFLKAPPR